jgi:hypothetical protein
MQCAITVTLLPTYRNETMYKSHGTLILINTNTDFSNISFQSDLLQVTLLFVNNNTFKKIDTMKIHILIDHLIIY